MQNSPNTKFPTEQSVQGFHHLLRRMGIERVQLRTADPKVWTGRWRRKNARAFIKLHRWNYFIRDEGGIRTGAEKTQHRVASWRI